ncbi:Pycsar system effector family protein [Streptomyces sp. NPDC047108]|uniref:Pycsar system effector family protein n=1 Tax=Streptomyces sp. NPDC047108 TaxID=3155025 RepID=UPI0033D7D1D0
MPPSARNPQQDRSQDRLAATVTALQGDLARSEGKASLLLALSGAALVGLVSAATNLHPPLPAAVFGALGAAALLAATLLLLLAVRPQLGGTGWPSWPRLSAEQLNDELASGYQPDHLRFMAALATRKFCLIRAAVDAMVAGISLLAVAAALGVMM